MAETIDSVFRDFNTPGNPGSGEYEPEKPRIRALLRQIEASGGQSVTRGTLAQLNAVTPPTDNYGGVVLNDPNPANNGYYYRDSGAWVKGRGFPDTFAELILSGSANAQTGAVGAGVNPSDIDVFWARVLTENTGHMTLNSRPVLNVDGSALTGGEWTGTVLFVDNGPSYQLIFDTQAARRAVESADRAEQEADRAAGYVNDIVAEKEVPIYSTISGMSSIAVPDGMDRIYVSGQSTVGDGLGGMFIDSDNGAPVAFTSAAGAGATPRNWYRAGDVGDERLAAPANITYLNQTETTLEFYGGDAVEMFSVSPARKFSIGPGNIEFNEPFSVPAGAHLSIDRSAIFVPTFEPVGPDRATPLITLGTGVTADNLRAHLDAGINTIRTLFKVGSECQVGYVEATSTDLNNNRTEPGSTDVVSGALLIEGNRVRVGQAYFNRFDRGWCVVNSQDVVIEKVRNIETIMGGYVHGTRDLHVLTGYTTGAPNSLSTAMPRPRGIMVPGGNSLVLAGCSDSSFGLGGGWWSYDTLEHAIRVGSVAAGTAVPNYRIAFGALTLIRPYGCGFKMDDGDDFNIKRIQVASIYTEDVGNGNWFGDPDYQNWSTHVGGVYVNNPALDNDGNKVAVAIRNSQYVQIGNVMNRASPSQDYSGNFGFWIERSNNVATGTIDTEKSKSHGVVIQSGGPTSPERITIPAVASRQNGGDGVRLNALPSNAVWRGVQVLNIDSQNNTGYGVSVTGRQSDGLSPFATLKSRISGIVSGNTAGAKDINANVDADPDFIDNVTAV